jgi:hypothetical protein
MTRGREDEKKWVAAKEAGREGEMVSGKGGRESDRDGDLKGEKEEW